MLSPLSPLSKSAVRACARAAGLPNWDWAASPCLRSRLALGVPATASRLGLVEEAEAAVASVLGLGPHDAFRVRVVADGAAEVALEPRALAAAGARDGESWGPGEVAVERGAGGGRASPSMSGGALAGEVVLQLLSLGFESVRFRRFRSGELAGVADLLERH